MHIFGFVCHNPEITAFTSLPKKGGTVQTEIGGTDQTEITGIVETGMVVQLGPEYSFV